MKTMKTCKMGCGKMKAGGPVKKIKMAAGGQAYMTKTMPGYNATTNPMVMKAGGMVDKVKHSCAPGLVRLASGGCGTRPLYGG
jgi:hypothetical protein